MPHVIVNSPLSQEEIAAAFEPVKFSQDDVHVSIAEVFQSQYDGKLLLETYVKERPLSQRLGLLIRQREKGDYVVKMHEVGFPRAPQWASKSLLPIWQPGWLACILRMPLCVVRWMKNI